MNHKQRRCTENAPTSNHVYIVKSLKHTLYITCCWELLLL